MTRKTTPRKGKGWHRFHVRSGLSCHKTDARRKRNIYHTSGAKYQERSAGKTLSLVTGLGVIITMFSLEAVSPGTGSCVRIDLNHLSRHEHTRRRSAEKVLKKNESQRCVKGERGEIDELLMFLIILRVWNIFISLFPLSVLVVPGPG